MKAQSSLALLIFQGVRGAEMRSLVLVFCLMISSGCSTIISGEPRFESFVGAEYSLEIDAVLFESNCSSSWSEPHILATKDYKIPFNNYGCPSKKVGVIGKKSLVKVKDVIKAFAGESGYCWRVVVTITEGEYMGLNADVPACFHQHPRPSWINSRYPEPGVEIDFKPEFLSRVEKR